MSLASHSVPPLACYGAVFALLLRRLVCVSSRSSRRPGCATAWVSLASTWHAPLLLLGSSIAAVRIAFLLFQAQDSWQTVRLEWLLLELPSALIAVFASYLLLIHTHIAFFHTWPARLSSTLVSLRCLLVGFSVLVISTTTLFAISRCAADSPLTPTEWNSLHFQFSSVVWIVLGAMLLRYQVASAQVLWQERDAQRLVVVTSLGINSLLMAETLLSLTILFRGVMLGMLAVAAPRGNQAVLPPLPSAMTFATFFCLYGSWEVLTLLVIYQLSSVVPVMSRSRRAREGEGAPVLSARDEAQHVLLFSPKEAVAEYWKAMSTIKQSQSRIASRRLDETSSYTFEQADEDTGLATAHEPLLSGVAGSDDEDGDDHRDFAHSSERPVGRFY